MMDTWLETKVSISFKFVQPHSGIVWEQIFKTDDLLLYVRVYMYEYWILNHTRPREYQFQKAKEMKRYFTQVAGLH